MTTLYSADRDILAGLRDTVMQMKAEHLQWDHHHKRCKPISISIDKEWNL